jgi:uncharacterized protein YukE
MAAQISYQPSVLQAGNVAFSGTAADLPVHDNVFKRTVARHMWNGAEGKRFFSRFSDWERCGHMFGLFECSRTTAGLDEIREESG